MKIAFNTGRLYTEHGQRIGAWVQVDDGVTFACFVDFDRMVTGYFPVNMAAIDSPWSLRNWVKHVYDYSQYDTVYRPMMASDIRDVERAGYDAFVSNPEVKVLK